MPHRRVRGWLSCSSCLQGCEALNGCATPVVMKEQDAAITASPSTLEWAALSGVFELFLGTSASLWSEGGGGIQVACLLRWQRGVMLTKL